jgi:hypothetical protein
MDYLFCAFSGEEKGGKRMDEKETGANVLLVRW